VGRYDGAFPPSLSFATGAGAISGAAFNTRCDSALARQASAAPRRAICKRWRERRFDWSQDRSAGNFGFGRNPSLSLGPLYARYSARSCSPASGHYPPNWDVPSPVCTDGVDGARTASSSMKGRAKWPSLEQPFEGSAVRMEPHRRRSVSIMRSSTTLLSLILYAHAGHRSHWKKSRPTAYPVSQ
jgi:hypothetical protein